MTFDFSGFIDRQVALQDKYECASVPHGGKSWPIADYTDGERYDRTDEYLFHLVEEVIEARSKVKRRRWKGDKEQGFLENPQMRSEFITEMADQLIIFAAVCAYAGVSGDEVVSALEAKVGYNQVRTDHATNDASTSS